MTVGVGREITSGIRFSIKEQSPDRVLFVYTRGSMQKYSRDLRRICKELRVEYEERLVEDPNDVDKLTKELSEILFQEKRRAEEVYIDITFGTKAMTAALYLSGFVEGALGVSYISGERDPETGRVVSGTEKLIKVTFWNPAAIFAAKRAIRLHNAHLYGSALQLLDEIAGVASRIPNLGPKMGALYKIISVAYHWDRFEFSRAADVLGSFSEEELRHLWELLGLPGKPEANFLKALEDYLLSLEGLNPSLAWELIDSAERRASIGFWEDATARLYRAMEFIGQVTLSRLGYFDGKVFKGIGEFPNLPAELRQSLEKDTEVLGLRDVYRRLKALGHPLGDEVIAGNYEVKPEVGAILSARNRSILAHGFKPGGEEAYSRFRGLVLKLVKLAEIPKPKFRMLKLEEAF